MQRALSDAGDVQLVLLDVSMPRMTGLQAAREITRRNPEIRVLMLSMHDNERYFFEALEAGASGYVLKTAADRDVVNACRAAMRGEPFLYPGAVRALVRDYLERARQGETLASQEPHHEEPREEPGQVHVVLQLDLDRKVRHGLEKRALGVTAEMVVGSIVLPV